MITCTTEYDTELVNDDFTTGGTVRTPVDDTPERIAAILQMQPRRPIPADRLAAAITALLVKDSVRSGRPCTATVYPDRDGNLDDMAGAIATARSTHLKEDHEALRAILQELGTATVHVCLD